LKAAGCTDAYTAANLVIDATTGEVTGKKNVDAGYVDTVCVKCANTAGSTVTFDNWTVTQKPNCETLTANTMTAKDYAYDTTATTTIVYAANANIFANSKSSACPILSCTLT